MTRYLRLAAALAACWAVTGCGGGSDSSAGSDADRALLKATVHSTALGLAAVAVQGGTYDADTLRTYVHAARFLGDQSGYFYIYDDTNDVCIAHAVLHDWEGQDKSDYQDSRGMYVIRELSAIARTSAGAGYLVFHWNNPASGREERKLGYVEVIPGTTLYIGSGIYIP